MHHLIGADTFNCVESCIDGEYYDSGTYSCKLCSVMVQKCLFSIKNLLQTNCSKCTSATACT